MKLAVFKGFENSKNGLTVERVLELADFVTTLCQAGDASGIKDLVALHNREALKPTTNFPGLNLSEVKGAELTLTAPKGDQSFKKTCPVERLVPSFTLTVEGNKAKLTCHAPGQLCFKFNNHFAKNGSTNFFMGDVDNYVECEFDLSDPDAAKLTSVHFGQTVEMPERKKAVQDNWAHL